MCGSLGWLAGCDAGLNRRDQTIDETEVFKFQMTRKGGIITTLVIFNFLHAIVPPGRALPCGMSWSPGQPEALIE